MHAFVFSLLQEGVYPARITTLSGEIQQCTTRTVSETYHKTDTLEVAKSGCDHPGYACDGLEK
jgi:hypothetical protein